MPASSKRIMKASAASASPKEMAGGNGQRQHSIAERLFPSVFGGFLGLSMLKFGNPPVTEKWVTVPSNGYEFLLGYPWPISWAMLLLGAVTVAGLFVAKWRALAPRWLLGLPLAWFGWQIISATQTVEPETTRLTVQHFAGCLVCFYLGCFSLSRCLQLGTFWLGLLAGLALVIIVGWEQHFGGLEATRRYFFLYIYPTMKEIPPGYLKKMSGNRIFSTLFYPNALAGVLLLLVPATLGVIQTLRGYFTKPALTLLQMIAGISALSCLYWSGSKGGWLLALLLGVVTLLRLPVAKKLKTTVAIVFVVAGVAGFFWKYAVFFQRGATSVSARMDYWHAAMLTAGKHPVLGTGPGSFFIPYMEIKRPESEPAKLVHNDYLEQASDSGIPGFLFYTGFIVAALVWTFRKYFTSSWKKGMGGGRGEQESTAQSAPSPPRNIDLTLEQTTANNWLIFGVWVGLLGWSLQGLIEFSLYIPGSAWPAFALLGWVLQRERQKASC